MFDYHTLDILRNPSSHYTFGQRTVHRINAARTTTRDGGVKTIVKGELK